MMEQLGTILGDGWWSVEQRHSNTEGTETVWKLVFEDLPAVLIVDFFRTNTIRTLEDHRDSRGYVELMAYGLDDIPWRYRLRPSTKQGPHQ